MKKAKKLLAKLMVFALILAYIPAPANAVSAASSKVNTKKYTISKKAGTYTSAFKLTITAKKGYKVYYTTGSSLTTSKVIKSGKKKTIKISKTTTLKVYAVKKSTIITKKKLKTSAVKKNTKSYKYKIKTADETTTETTTTDTTTADTTTASTVSIDTSTTANTEATTQATSASTENETAASTQEKTTAASTEKPASTEKTTETDAKSEDEAQNELTSAASTAKALAETTEAAIAGTSVSGESIATLTLSELPASDDNVTVTTTDEATTVTLKTAGNYTVTGSAANTIIAVDSSLKDAVGITFNNAVIDNSELTSDSPVISSTKAPLVLTLTGESTITGAATYTNSPVSAIIYNKKSITIKGDGTLNVIDSNTATDFGSNDPSDGIASKDSLVIEGGTVNVTANGDALKGTGDGIYDYADKYDETDENYTEEVNAAKYTTNSDGTVTVNYPCEYEDGGITISGGTLKLTSNLGKGISSKKGLITISGGDITIDSYDHAISAKNYNAQITGGTVNIASCGGDGIKAGNKAYIAGTDTKVTIDKCYGDGIQAEDLVIAEGTVDIKTYYEYANTNFYTTNSISGNSYNSSSENEGTGLKSETINYDTGSHKALKAGSKEKTFSYTAITDTSDCDYTAGTKYYQEASGGLTITGGTITLDTTNAGIKYNGGLSSGGSGTGSAPGAGGMGGDSKTIIGSPDDAIHSNNSATISGGTITIKSSDDGVSVVNDLYILNGASVDVQTAYEGVEASNTVIGATETEAPTVSVYTNDDGFNAAKKNQVTYVYANENEESYTKTSYKTSDNSLTINDGKVTVKIGDDTTHTVTLSNKDEEGVSYSFSADGDGIDCNGSFYAYGGEILVVGGTSGGNGAIDRDDNFILGSGVTLFAIGSNGMVEGVTQADQAYVETSSASIASGDTVKISSADGTELYSYTADKSAGYILFSAPGLTSGSSYTLLCGSTTSSLTATTEASSGGMGGGGTPPDGGAGGPGDSSGGPGGNSGGPGGSSGGPGGNSGNFGGH